MIVRFDPTLTSASQQTFSIDPEVPSTVGLDAVVNRQMRLNQRLGRVPFARPPAPPMSLSCSDAAADTGDQIACNGQR